MIAEVCARLKDRVTALRRVAAVGGLIDAQSGLDRDRLPAAFVHLVSDRAGPNTLATGAVSQQVERTIGVALCIGALGEGRTAEVADQFEPLLVAVRGALVGFVPSADQELIKLARGALVRIDKGLAWWVDEYRTSILLRST